MVNGLFSLLHGVVVVVAIGAAVTPATTSTSHSRGAISQPPPSSNNLDSAAGVQVGTAKPEVIAERNAVPPRGDAGGDFHLLEETGSADDGHDSNTRNLRGQRITVNKNSDPSYHRTKANVIESPSNKSPDVVEGRQKKRFLRWAGDEQETAAHDESSGNRRVKEAHHGKAAAAAAAGRYLRISGEGVVVEDAAEASPGRAGSDEGAPDVLPQAQESSPARFGHGAGSQKSVRGGGGRN